MQEFTKLLNNIDFGVVSNSAAELAELSHFKDQVLLYLVKLSSNEFKSGEVPLVSVLLEVEHLILELVKLAQNHGNLDEDGLLALLTILQVAQCLLLEVAIDEERLDFLEVHEEIFKFLVIILLDGGHFFAHGPQLANLVLHFLLELIDFAFEIGDGELVQHDYLMVPMVT